MNVQRVAQIFGWVFVVVAILGFFTSGTSMVADMDHAPRMLGLFPVNLLHNLVHLAFGVWGILAARSFSGAVAYCRISGAIYLVLAVMGFITPTTFGLIPIGGLGPQRGWVASHQAAVATDASDHAALGLSVVRR